MPPRLPQDALSQPSLDPERVAYWYLRLNGFLLLENFIVHDVRTGSQRTDADLIGVRFRHRREFAFDSDAPMTDDAERLRLSDEFDDVVIVEVKTNQPCTLNGPWTDPPRQNVHRVLAAIGCLPHQTIPDAAARLYENGMAIHGEKRIRLVAIGRDHNDGLLERYRDVAQLTWDGVLSFIWCRFDQYRREKRDVSQWDCSGQILHGLADRYRRAPDLFIANAKRAMSVRHHGGV